jgi:hypothetical protein
MYRSAFAAFENVASINSAYMIMTIDTLIEAHRGQEGVLHS